jgi:hypothetical protein
VWGEQRTEQPSTSYSLVSKVGQASDDSSEGPDAGQLQTFCLSGQSSRKRPFNGAIDR